MAEEITDGESDRGDIRNFGKPTTIEARAIVQNDAARIREAANPDIALGILHHASRRGAGLVLAGVLDPLELRAAFDDAGEVSGLDPVTVTEVVTSELGLARRRRRARGNS